MLAASSITPEHARACGYISVGSRGNIATPLTHMPTSLHQGRPEALEAAAFPFDMPPNLLAVVDMHDVMSTIGPIDCKWPSPI